MPTRTTLAALAFAGLLGCCELLWRMVRTGSTERGGWELAGLLLVTLSIYGVVLGAPAAAIRRLLPLVPAPALVAGAATALWGGVYFHVRLRGGSPWLSLEGMVGSALALLLGGLVGLAMWRWTNRRALAVPAACLFLLLGLMATAGASPTTLAQPPARPRAGWTFLIVVDTLGARHASLYGYERETTPSLDAFAADSVVFDHAVAPSSWTAPSMASVFTSIYPSSHQYRSFGALPSDALTLPELFHAAGFVTAGWSSNIVVSTLSNFHQGFSYFDDRQARISAKEIIHDLTLVKHLLKPFVRTAGAARSRWSEPQNEPLPGNSGMQRAPTIETRDSRGRSTQPQHRRLLDRLDRYFPDLRERRKAEYLNMRFKEWFSRHRLPGGFVYLHYMDPHKPYSPPPAYRRFGSDARARHDGDIAYWDAQFRDLLDFLEVNSVLEEATILVLGDHGEEFGEHGGTGHGHSLYEELVHVPLVIKAPGLPARRVTQTVSLVDVAPTLLELAGLSPQLPLTHGKSLLPLLREDNPAGPDVGDVIFSEKLTTTRGRSLRATYADGWKLILDPAAGRAELFELATDPFERIDRVASEQSAAVQQVLQLHPRLFADPGYLGRDLSDGESTDATGELFQTLKALGYVQ